MSHRYCKIVVNNVNNEKIFGLRKNTKPNKIRKTYQGIGKTELRVSKRAVYLYEIICPQRKVL